LSIARIDSARGILRHVGVGNVAAVILATATGETRSLVSQNGTVGHTIRRVQAFDYGWDEGSLLLMHSDGLETRWSLDRYAALSQRHPSLVAAVLYGHHKRARDDVTVLAVRRARATPP
jgi:hypothetical protein